MEHSRARGRLPAELDGLLSSQISFIISEANLGLSDRQIAERYYLDRLPQIDIAVEMGFDRTTVTKRLKGIAPRICMTANKLNIKQ